jgi:glucokinase
VKLAPVFRDGTLAKGQAFAVPEGTTPRQLARLIRQETEKLKSRARFTAAGAGVPGHVANNRRTLLYAPNLGWSNVPFAGLLKRELGLPVILENDVNAAALGEQRFGAGRGARQVICIFAGTGVGGGIMTDGKLLRGATGNAAEVGHTIFRPGGRTCGCGRKGCVEAYAGGAHIPAHYSELGGKKGLNATQIWQRARKGDRRARRVTADAVQAIVTLLVNLQTLFDAERIVLGGGVIDHVGGLYREIKGGMQPYLTGPWKSQVKIVRSRLGANAGILGAATLAAELP